MTTHFFKSFVQQTLKGWLTVLLALAGIVAYAQGPGPKVAVFGAEQPIWTDDVKAKIAGTGLFSQVDGFDVRATTPTLVQLQGYQAVLVYTDYAFANPIAMGNVLADYVDAGGGVVVATFAFVHSSFPWGVQGRLVTGGYLPFTQASYTGGTPFSLIPDLPTHPILAGVSSFNGGSSSYHNTPLAIAPGATLVAHWSNGQPLVGTQIMPGGRVAGLNFFPPSSDARGDFWAATTDGARLMANALLWTGFAYDLSFMDDNGRMRLCLNSTTGAWKAQVLLGFYQGTYQGQVAPITRNGALVLPPAPPGTQAVWGYYDPASHRASFTLRMANGGMAFLFDTSTTGQAGGCGGD